MEKKRLQLAAIFLVFSFVLGFSQDRNLEIEDSITILQVCEVQAIRVSDRMPITHSNIHREEIEKNNFGQDVPYLLQNMPSVYVTSDAGNGVGYTDIRMRGVDASRINVTTNGVPMNDAESHKMYWVDAPDLASAVGSIQVQRGAGSSTNGAGAFGGSINMTTAPLQSDFGGEASLSYGMYNTNKQSLNINSGLIGKHWYFNGRLSHIYSDGYVDRASTNLNSFLAQLAYSKGKTMIKFLSFGGKERTYNAWDGITKEQMNKNRRYNSCGEIQDAEGNVIGFYDNQTDNYLQWNNQLVFDHRFSYKWTLNVVGHYTYGDGYYQQYKNDQSLSKYMLPETTELDHSNLIRKKSMNNDFYGVVASVNYVSSKFLLSLGASANQYSGEHWGNVLSLETAHNLDLSADYYRNETDKKDANAFIKATYEILPRLNLYGDLQYRRIRHEIWGTNSSYDYTNEVMQEIDVDKTYDFFNPKAGLNYSFARYNSAYFSFAVAQREPTRDDFSNAVKGDDGKLKTPEAEKMYDYEVGYQFKNRFLNLGLNVYYMDYDNQLVLTGQENLDTYDVLYENVKNSYRRGIEFSLGVNPLSWLTVAGNVTYSKNCIEDYTEYVYSYDTWDMVANELGTTTISYSPDIIAGLLLNVHYKKFEASITTRYVSDQYITNSEQEDMKLDAYNVTNLQLNYSLKTKKTQKVRFGLSVNNIFNNKYCSSAFGSSIISEGVRYNDVLYFPQATTNVLGNITVEF